MKLHFKPDHTQWIRIIPLLGLLSGFILLCKENLQSFESGILTHHEDLSDSPSGIQDSLYIDEMDEPEFVDQDESYEYIDLEEPDDVSFYLTLQESGDLEWFHIFLKSKHDPTEDHHHSNQQVLECEVFQSFELPFIADFINESEYFTYLCSNSVLYINRLYPPPRIA